MSIVLNLLNILENRGIKLDLNNDENLVINGDKRALDQTLINTIKAEKQKIVDYLLQKKKKLADSVISVIDRENTPLLLSFAQQRLWLLDHIDGGSAHYNMSGTLRLSGAINHDALNRAYTSVLERHESLRTNFCIGNDGQPLQVVQPSMPFLVPITDLSALQEDERQRQITRLIAEEAGREFNLSQDLMLRTSLLKLAADEHILLVTMHHIASDGWSMAILINEVSALYRAYVQGRKNPLSPLAIQYIDYAHWQRTWLQGEVLDQQLEYWATQLNKLPAVHGLPLDYPRPKVQTFIGNTYHTYLDGVTFQALNALCQANGATLFMGLHAAFSVLLARYSNETDIVIGSPIANREQPEVAGLIGFFVNTLVLRCDLSDNPDFITLLQQSKRMLMGAYEHQQVPFEQIVERLQPQRSRNHSALFQIMLVLQNNQAGVLALPGLSASAIDPDGSIAKYDLTLNIVDTAQGLQLGWNYNTDLFEATTIERMAAHFAIVLQSLTQAPGQSVFQATMLSAAEQHQLLVEWNDTASDYPHEQCIHHLFEQQVEKNPDAVALVCNHQQLTYRELNQRANQLAHYLIEHKQVKPDTLVGICLERSLEMVVGILGILKAGAAYVPLDPDYPAARLAYMVADAKLTTILTQRHVCRTSLNNDVHAVCLDAELVQQQCRAQAVTNIPASQIGLQSHHLAYLIYTSGSTGNPKGVMVAHRNTVAFLSWARVTYDQQQLRCVLASTSVCFDLSIFEMFAPLSVGGTALIVKNILELHPDLSEPNITLINTVPSAMEALLAGNRIPKSVTTVNLAGEPLKQKIVDSLYSKGINAVYDLYGPSEDTTYSTYVLRTFRGVASIGKPIHNSQVYVLNPLGQLVPVHTAGELYIGGAGLARGYLNRPELTAEKFIANPFYDKTNPASSERLYRTGDLVRWRHDGNLEFLGRIDHQVKIRGFRIELGEIEQALASHPQVKDALVLAKESASGDKRLLAYVVSAGVATEQLRQHLAQTLPDYMIPAVFVLLERFPLTPNGKVDRKALPEPDTSASQAHHVAPRTDMEHALCALWQEVLGVERVGITDDFFRLGGHSLSATRLMARINQTFNVALPLKTLFHCPTLGELAQTLLLGDAGLGRPALVPVSRAQTLLPSYAQQRLWLLDQIDGGSAHYNMSGGIRLTGHLNYAALDQAFTSIIERHQSLRTCFTNGDDGQVQQVIQAATSLVVPFLDFSGTMPGERQLQLAEQITDEASRAFDLSRDMMLRAQLIKLAQDEHVLLVTMHHIASDGWSMAILMNEFSALYQAYVQGQANPLPPLAIQYADYAHWQRTWLQGEVLDQQLSYWTGQLANLPLVHSVPLDHARPKVQTFNGETYHSQIEVPTRDALNALCQSSGATLFMGLHAVFSVLLARYSNETDIVLGSPIANREQAEVAGLIGFFVNTLVLRSDLSGNPSFSTLLEQSKRLLLDAYAHQQVPFDQIVERLQPQRSLSHGALFQIMLVLQNNESATLDLPGLSVSAIDPGVSIAKYDLTLNIADTAQGLQLGWNYNTDLFEATTIERMAAHFAIVLQSLTQAPGQSVFQAPMLSAAEQHQLLIGWNDTTVDYPREKCIHELFEEQVVANPDAVAVMFEAQQLSYAQLNAQANQLAHYLIKNKQVRPDTLVGVCIERSLDMVIALLAILKAGAAYVPLDPDYPAARLAYMLDDACLDIVLTQHRLGGSVPVSAQQAVYLDAAALQSELSAQPDSNISPKSLGLQSHHLAYVIYTSGSTGNPKGTLLTHTGLCNLAMAQRAKLSLSSASRILQFASIAFDAATWELCMALPQGASVVLIRNESAKSADAISAIVDQYQITHATLPPVLLPLLNPSQWQSVETLIVAGEACSEQMAAAWSTGRQFINAYGPSETTVCATMGAYQPGQARLHIGQPLQNMTVHVLNRHHQLVPPGGDGELYIGGVGLARGYLNRPELTAEKFIANPFYDKTNPASSERLYKTGDLVRWLPDGNLEFMGRIDHQVKIRGFRIELGEIEQALASHAQVKDALVLAKESATGDKRLVAYVVSAAVADDLALANQAALTQPLRQHLAQSLPDYMIPAAFVWLQRFPLTPNGKVDRKALPEPDAGTTQAHYVAPRTELEHTLCALWQEVLGVERVGLSDNFFHLGGHSLSATRLMARINHSLNIALPLRNLFHCPTPGELAQALLHSDTGLGRPALVPVSRAQTLLPSYAQQRLWLLDQIDGGSAHYNMPGGIKLRGSLDYAALDQAFTSIIERHESLRTCFTNGDDGQVQQVVQAATSFVVPRLDFSGTMPGERQLQLAEQITDEASRAFDLSRDTMLRAQLIKLAQDEHVLLVTMHHIASDGWSMAILMNEFSALYQAYVQGQGNPLPPLTIQYADYAHWQRTWLQGEVLEQQLSYWTGQLANLPLVHGLPLDHARPKVQTFNGETYHSQIDVPTRDALNALCQSTGATLFMGLHAAFSVLLARYSNETDIVLGSPIANREQAEVAGLIGFFVNTLVLRSDLFGNPSFSGLLEQSKRLLLDAYAHQQVPFEQIVERLQPQRSLSHGALFQIMLVLQNNESATLDLPGLSVSAIDPGVSIAKYDLTLNIAETADGLQLGWSYNTDLFEAATIERMAAHFAIVLQSLTQAPGQSVFQANMLGAAERHQLLVEWNDTASDYPHEKCIHELFEEHAATNPDAVAVVFEAQQLSYGELNARANQLAHYLIEHKQVKPDTLVGICVERSLEMVVGILGILKAGGAYVPLDPDYPAARLAYMVADAKLTTILTQRHVCSTSLNDDVHAVCLDDELVQQQCKAQAVSNIPASQIGLQSHHLAYLIYTSGSTGNPKGVMLAHRSVVNTIGDNAEQFHVDVASVFLQSISLNFDAAGWVIWMALTSGAKCVIANDVVRFGQEMEACINRHHISHLMMTPSTLTLLEPSRITQAPTIIVGGEACSSALAQKWLPRSRFFNAYGPTEAAICTTIAKVECADALSIGQPIRNMTVYILDKNGHPTALGVAGELVIGGAGLARGYLNRPELTAEKFIANPFYDQSNPASSERLYKTGDLVRWRHDGNLEFLGRIDHQVKIRGFRIELGEIEQALGAHAQVKDALVLAKESASGDKRLLAYVVSAGVATEQLRQHLVQTLPDYMIPAAFVLLERFPLTPNGKVDRKALPEPDTSASQAYYVAPRTDMEHALCGLWQEVLGVEQVGITDDFFRLGGHSLLAAQMIARLRQMRNIEVPLRTLFVAPDIASLAASINDQAPASQFSNLIRMRAGSADPVRPMFLIHPGEGEIGYAKDLAPWLASGLTIYGLAATGFLDGETALESVPEMAAAYIKAIRHVQAHGPYRIAGWSAGGTIAYEMARQLIGVGERIEFLGLIDTSCDYSLLKQRMAGKFCGDADLDQANFLLMALPENLPESRVAELTTWARSGAVIPMLEHCRDLAIFPSGIDSTTLRRYLAVRIAILRALMAYNPQPLSIPISLFAATRNAPQDLALGWGALLGDWLRVAPVEGTHYTIMHPQNIQGLGLAISTALVEVSEA